MTQATQPCQHVVGLQPPPGDVCEGCAPVGATWGSLRQCMACGHVGGCCDSSPNRHARAHFQRAGHPVLRSALPGDDWWFCLPDKLTVRQEPNGRIVPISTGRWASPRSGACWPSGWPPSLPPGSGRQRLPGR
jgi:Zn-finger in ubiquitin-hydrolases and other protein